ncbi:2-succinyl-5-enolpyruvyl-6-hydroxy-3-cyclohexene-1-carboxylic-acid synthase [Enterococcus sp. DIV0086]|uniref:2-succinyl-5-enolpyruvyl-6-hydroxy-3- cyclohexene-1-carboxylic-acid synthase n=1 Tax=Enterococcus sp. DIV0086 TaxID=2774655 RepID=UPI003D2A472D
MNHQETMTDYLMAFIEGLKNSGVEQAVISPGSRSTPLALLLHRETAIQTFVDVDERSAAFFALGLSKASQKPVVLLCTSGTAAANYYPAICEANISHVPLVVLTTDRPHELRQVGAPQAMDQLQMYQNHVKLFVEMALPEATEEMLNYAYWQGAKGAAFAQQTPAAPVHLNFPLREPLLPDLERKTKSSQQTALFAGQSILSTEQVQQLADQWYQKNGVLVVGGSHTEEEAALFIQLAEALQWPLLADPLANIVTHGQNSEVIIAHSDLFLNVATLPQEPEVVVRFGSLPISKNIMLWLKRLATTETAFYFVDENGQWQEQLKKSQTVIQAKETTFVEQLLTVVKSTEATWLAQWLLLEKTVSEVLLETLNATELNETTASLAVHQTMKENGQLFVSNSMAIRYLDRFMDSRPYRMFGNRGINGIDGIVSTALGMSAVAPTQQNVLLIGDLALYHDMNGLFLAKRYQLPLTIVLLNNNGGGIFSFLSQRTLREDYFEPLFGTPLDLDFSLVAELYGASYQEVKTIAELKQILQTAAEEPQFQVIEVKGNRQENVHLYESILAEIGRRVERQGISWNG